MHTRLKLEEIPEDKLLFYDIETDNQFAPYAKLKMIGVAIGLCGKPYLLETEEQILDFHRRLTDPTILKFGWNSKSFDDIVLYRHNSPICEENSHDLMLVAKTVAPWLASFSLKFCNWELEGDPHFPEMELERWALKSGLDKWEGPYDLIKPYCLHDIHQTRQMALWFWDVVIRPDHWEPYLLDLSQGEPVREMELVGGLHLDAIDLTEKIATLQWEKLGWESEASRLTGGRVTNPNSGKQVGPYLAAEGFAMELTDSGQFSITKDVLLSLIDIDDEANDQNPVARCTYQVRQVNSQLKYFENYLDALNYWSKEETPEYHSSYGWIPIQISISNARTRRYTSNSMFGLNFQNPNKAAKSVQLVPEGWLGVWLDSTQVENVVHIYESEDIARRLAYERDPNWNEYAWLANRILGGDRTKEELDKIPSPQAPNWSIYKQFKTVKLAINFGMGKPKFCKSTGIHPSVGNEMFELIHEACPAIKRLQTRVANDIGQYGRVTDVFGHIYTGSIRKAYKVVAYLIQGTGTASLPKAQIRANYDVLHRLPQGTGVMCGTCHDENSMRLRLDLGPELIIATLQKLYFNMTAKFSPLFDNIPLRAKLYLSRTTAGEQEEIKITDLEKIHSYCK